MRGHYVYQRWMLDRERDKLIRNIQDIIIDYMQVRAYRHMSIGREGKHSVVGAGRGSCTRILSMMAQKEVLFWAIVQSAMF